jgi:hypothetical protein
MTTTEYISNGSFATKFRSGTYKNAGIISYSNFNRRRIMRRWTELVSLLQKWFVLTETMLTQEKINECIKLLSRIWMTIDGFWIDDRIYWTLLYIS